MKKIYLLALVLSIFNLKLVAQNKILFDNTKAETASNADWTIDFDISNLSFSNGPAALGGYESDPQRIPTPAQSGINASSSETYWTGAISAWGVDCVKSGYVVETLPYNGQITYGNNANAQDLSNYKLFVIVEPNIDFTAAERNAIISFVNNGGRLFIISDHSMSDRNGDNIDSPVILNKLMTLNTIQANPFGISFDNNNISVLTTNIASTTVDPLMNGIYGNVQKMQYSNGSTMTINTSQNPTVKAVIFNSGASNVGTTNVMCAYALFGSGGRVVAVGDSSVVDDGTGDSGDTLYNGYTGDASGNHQKLIRNATAWLMSTTLETDNFNAVFNDFSIAPNPIKNKQINLSYNLSELQNISVSVYDSLGRTVFYENQSNSNLGINSKVLDVSNLQNGIYICKLSSSNNSKTIKIIVD